jgi:hypothetical protein
MRAVVEVNLTAISNNIKLVKSKTSADKAYVMNEGK